MIKNFVINTILKARKKAKKYKKYIKNIKYMLKMEGTP